MAASWSTSARYIAYDAMPEPRPDPERPAEFLKLGVEEPETPGQAQMRAAQEAAGRG